MSVQSVFAGGAGAGAGAAAPAAARAACRTTARRLRAAATPSAAATSAAAPAAALRLEIRLDVRHQDLRIRLGDREADAADHRRQTDRQLLPRLAAVDGLVDAAVLAAVDDLLRIGHALRVAAADEAPRVADAIPERHVQDFRIRRIHHEAVRAGHLAVRQPVRELVPRLAAVDRLEHAAAADRRPDVAEGRDVRDVLVGRMQANAADVVRVLQADVLEVIAAVGRLVDAVTPRGRVALVAFAGADPDQVLVLLEDLDVADRRGAVGVEDRLPRRAAVLGLQHAAGRRADDDVGPVVFERIDGRDAADQIRVAEIAPGHVPEHRVRGWRLSAGLRGERGSEQSREPGRSRSAARAERGRACQSSSGSTFRTTCWVNRR